MKIRVFGKEIEIDENNKGVNFMLQNIGPTINETTTLFWYKLRANVDEYEAADDLRNMTQKEMQNCVMQNIRFELASYGFSKSYAKFIKKNYRARPKKGKLIRMIKSIREADYSLMEYCDCPCGRSYKRIRIPKREKIFGCECGCLCMYSTKRS